MGYTVRNRTTGTIYLKDGSWYSGEIDKGGERKIDSNHNADVTIFNGKAHGDKELGRAWIPKDGSIDVNDSWNWDIRP